MPFKCNKLLLTDCFANVLEILLSICHVAHDVSMFRKNWYMMHLLNSFRDLYLHQRSTWVTIKNEATPGSVYGLRSSEGKYL